MLVIMLLKDVYRICVIFITAQISLSVSSRDISGCRYLPPPPPPVHFSVLILKAPMAKAVWRRGGCHPLRVFPVSP